MYFTLLNMGNAMFLDAADEPYVMRLIHVLAPSVFSMWSMCIKHVAGYFLFFYGDVYSKSALEKKTPQYTM